MVKGKKEEKSDDIEITSVGKLYIGQWDKKYWSSSRGKDRYPYPVGYTSVRVQNGITYKMEILEGLNGPLFTISSTDGNSCSGDTADIAWESFQKKSCTQIKLRRGKRFSCKIDGVELYGFKNPFVQRLLRELVANDRRTEHSSLTPNVASRAPNTVNKLQIGEPIPDPVPCLIQTKVTRKRSRTSDKVINTKRLAETHSKQHLHGELAKEVSALSSKQRGKSDGKGSEHSVVPATPIAERGEQLDPMDMSDHPKGHRSISEKTDEDYKVEHGMPGDANLFAPDTLDHAGDSLCVLSLDKDGQITCNTKDAIVNNESKSDILLTDLQPEDEKGTTDSCTFSDNCDIDIGQEVAKSMMAFLLPQAIPLLKTFTRKKRKSPKPEAISVHGCLGKNNVPNSNLDDGFISRKLLEQSNISSTGHGHDLPVPTSGYTQSVVPESLDNDDHVDPNTSKGDKDSNILDSRLLTIGTGGDAKTDLCLSGTKKRDTNLHMQARSSSIEKPPKAGELVEQSNISSSGHDSLVSTSGYTQSVVPDSLDNDDPVNCRPKTSKGYKDFSHLDTCGQLTIGTNADANTVVSLSEIKKREINLHLQAQSSSSEKPPKTGELVEQSNISSSTGHDSLVSTSGYTQSVVPDSLDNDDLVNSRPKTSNGDKDSSRLDICAQLTIGTNGDAKTVLSLSEIKKREINLHSQARSSEKPPKVRRLAEQSNISSQVHDSLVSTSGYTDSAVPDSLNNDDPVDSLSNTSKGCKDFNKLDTRAQLAIGTNGDAKPVLCLSESTKCETNLQSQARSSSSEKPPKGPILAPDAEIIAYSRKRQKNCLSIDKQQSLPASIVKPSPGIKSTNYKSPANANFPKSFKARVTGKLLNEADLNDRGVSTPNLQHSGAVNYHSMSVNGEIKNRSRLNIQKLNGNPHGLLDLFAGYVFPMPISTVQLIVKEEIVYVCVKCCSLGHKESTIFVYMAPKRGENIGCPSLIGYLPLGLESSKDIFGGDSAVDNSIFQFIPDVQFLVLRNDIRTPFCREGKLHCLCSSCTSDCLKKNAIKIVQINSGYASLVRRLETAQDVRCLLVCEPNFLLAADEGGKLKLWTLNSSWSAQVEHCYLPTHDSLFPCLVELKGVPKSTVLVIGHNCLGEFGLWDIEKRTLVSRFSSPGMSMSRCIPACHFNWKRSGNHRTEKLIGEIMDATKISFAERYKNHNFSVDDKDSAIWLLISTVSDPDSQCYQSSEQQQENQVEYWRLALLVNNTVIVGSALDSGAAAVTSAGLGIIGTCDGLVYIWELSTGTKLGNLHSFKGSDSSVSYITSDTSNSGAVAIASGSQLLIYLPS